MVSVINQMLKDLERRAPEQGQAAIPVAVSHKPSTIKIILISLAVLLSLNLLGFYIWNLQERVVSSELKIKEQEQQRVSSSELKIKEQEQQEQQRVSSRELKVKEQEQVQQRVSSDELKIKEQEQVQQRVSSDELKIKEQEQEQQRVSSRELKVKEQEQIQQRVVNNELKVKEQEQEQQRVSSDELKVKVSKMSVSRRQLTSAELVTKKLAKAEKAVNINDITKAEQLFEEVLIIEPKQQQARKNLAALWFGRKSYQQAINLLSQGIALDGSDAELRMLKARIHLQLGQKKAAYNTLKPLAMHKQQEYQVMLANLSQQLEQYPSAINAYKILIDMQTYSGRWHLGLAIVYDKNSQFPLAITEYALALTKPDLSVASAEFAQQRMQALGE